MANNTILNVGTLGDVIRDIDRAGVKTQVAQLDIGGTAAELLVIAGQQTMANSLPVVIASNQPAITAQIANNAVLSGSNSSVAVLAANAAFTGPADDITEYADVRVTVFSDVASAADGLQLQQSTNGTNWDSIDAYSIPANSGKTFSVGVSARFFRVVYTNGATVQAAFRLQTKYNKTYSKASSVRPQDGRTNDNDAEEVVAYVAAFNGTTWDRLRSSAKAIQGAFGITVQDIKDAGRVNVAITCYQAAGIITTEALFAAATFALSRDGAAATTSAQFTVTTGKRFRLQAVEVSIKNNTNAAGTSKLVLRYLGAGGTITNTSPILAMWDLGTNGTVTGAYIGPAVINFPDGVELIGLGTFGFTSLCSAITMLHTITLNGYEY